MELKEGVYESVSEGTTLDLLELLHLMKLLVGEGMVEKAIISLYFNAEVSWLCDCAGIR